ncbi:unnamed protein product [Prorocentrum cordatum]|uniref:Prolyl oligopeptidase n=1 Tax=Prorocentrum cordatum TaxID=2364126 RepID=A0ABN9PNL6_9DINO|nr:unnamed protein product [Polarella glacialis]
MADPALPERLAGPAGPGAARAAWDSALAELSGGGPDIGRREVSGSFSLWLWRFYEAWRQPTGAGPQAPALAPATGDAHASQPPGVPRASVLEREETRVTLAGVFQARQAAAVSMQGFRRRDLNQTYAEEPGQEVAGLPTWWSEDGRYFIYYAEEYAHWKVNALRSAGGDGLAAVLPGARRAGCGFAHSGAVGGHGGSQGAAAAALCDPEGWFELAEGDWEPAQPRLERLPALAMSFTSDAVQAESVVAAGEDSTRERRGGGSVEFRGIPGGGKRLGQPRGWTLHAFASPGSLAEHKGDWSPWILWRQKTPS